MKNTLDDRYTSGEYLEKNPTFHIERADFKAGLVSGILKKIPLNPNASATLAAVPGKS